MCCRVIAGVILILAIAQTFLFAQISTTGATNYPHIVVTLPDDIVSDTITIWYFLMMVQHGHTGPVRPQRNVRRYTINALIGDQPAQSATIYVYSPGCQFKVYDFDLRGKSDVEQRFECVPLPRKTIHGFILPVEIPLNFFSQRTELEISAELEANWICSDAFRQIGGGGSCGVPSIHLGKVGTLNPADDGNFELDVPDFTEDPVFKNRAQQPAAVDFGFIELSLTDRQVGRTVGTIASTDSNSPKSGLGIEAEYPDPVIFRATR